MSSDTNSSTSRSNESGSSDDSTRINRNTSNSNSETHYNQVSFLPIVHAIINTIEKDNQDASQKNRDSLEASQKVTELSKKIETARAHIYKLPGITESKDIQAQHLKNLHTQLEMKKKLIDKYKGLNMKLGGTPPLEQSLIQLSEVDDNLQK